MELIKIVGSFQLILKLGKDVIIIHNGSFAGKQYFHAGQIITTR